MAANLFLAAILRVKKTDPHSVIIQGHGRMDDESCTTAGRTAHRGTNVVPARWANPDRRRARVGLALSLLIVLPILPLNQAEAACLKPVAKAVSVQGDVEVRRAGAFGWRPLMRGQALCGGDRARANSNSRADILLGGHTHMRLDQQTTIRFPRPTPKKRTWLNVIKGVIDFISRTPERLEIDTPYVNAAIEGTEFAVRIEDDRTLVWVYEGRVVASNAQGALTLTNGDAAVAERGQAPRPQVDLHSRDAVEWALYYPPLLDLRTLSAGPSNVALAKAIALYQKGDVPAALTTLDNVPNAEGDARYFNIRTALLLSVGRVKKAQAAIVAARQRDPQSAAPRAYESIIALSQNREEKARELAEQSVALEPESPIAHAARSYALQASFDLEGALANARRTVELASKDALAWARLAELELSRGYSDAAINAAKKSKALDPAVARTQSVLGFVDLARIDTDQASQAFNAAIERDQADPLPRLGLGLAKIREGDLSGGRRDIEIAASLDPSQSIVRSYLGKAYFDEKRDPLAAEQYAMAKELDPKDPTPWFYDAILKQTENRPVEALHDIQRSIKLNNNRAVYRSRLLLDQDLAARSASQARIYRDLGFGQLALVEGWKSVNTDPSSYAAHRFLADSYSTLPRDEIARVSELLQSQLLQPLNLTPIQPQLSTSDPLILEGAGPSALAFNEFNPLFLRNGVRLQTDGVVGSNGTLGEDVVVSGIHDWLSYSFGQFHFESDGFRENNDQASDLYNAFVQASLSPSTSVQAEVRSQRLEIGDLSRSLHSNSHFFPNLRIQGKIHVVRLGLHHAFALGKDLLVSLVEQHRDGSSPVEKSDLRSYMAEAQQQLNYRSLGLITGVGYARSNIKSDFSEIPDLDTVTHQLNGYLYSHIDLPSHAVLNLGASVDDFLDNQFGVAQREHQVNPKFGVIWNPVPSTTLRAAAFRVLKRTIITNQTLEPTQVAGFNQFFDDVSGTDSTRWGLALDQEFSDRLYGGVEYSERDLEVPHTLRDPSTCSKLSSLTKEYWEEDLARAYLFYAPGPRWALRIDPSYEFFDRRDFDSSCRPLSFATLRTLRAPLGVSYFHPSGISAALAATYFDQEGLVTNTENNLEEARQGFWTMDAQLSYRLPKRRGIVSLSFNNFLDEDSPFQEIGAFDPLSVPQSTFFPERTILLRVSFSL